MAQLVAVGGLVRVVGGAGHLGQRGVDGLLGFFAGDPVSDFDPLWWALATLGLGSAAVSLGIDTRTPAPD